MKNKKRVVLGALSSAMLLAGTFGFLACEEETPPKLHGYGESGAYYFASEEGEYLLSLVGGDYTLVVGGEAVVGSYTYDGTTIKFYDENNVELPATIDLTAGVVELEIDGGSYQFLKKNSYVVTYADADATISTVSVVNGKTVAKPADPVKAGYDFIGWYADAEFTTPFAFNSVPVNGNTTIYARFVQSNPDAEEYEVDFVVNGEAYGDVKKTIGGVVYDLPTPNSEDKTFLGWWVSDTESGEKLTYKYAGQQLKAHTTLYAVWSDSLAVSVTANNISWTSAGTGANYTLQIFAPNGTKIHEATSTSTECVFDFSTLEAGEYRVEVTAGETTVTNYYTNKSLDRVSDFYVSGAGMLIFNAVENAEKYLIGINCGNGEHAHEVLIDNGLSTNYNFTGCEMQEGGITFVVYAVANGYATSVSEEYSFERNLAQVSGLKFVAETGKVEWKPVVDATKYAVEITNGNDVYKTEVVGTSVSVKEYSGEVTVKVTALASGYNVAEATELVYESTKLAMPNVNVSHDKIIWTDVGATKYVLTFGDKTIEVEGTEYVLQTEDFVTGVNNYEVTVQAIAEDPVNNSFVSESVVAKYEVMGAVRYEAGKLYWEPVLGAYGYAIKVNGIKAKTVGADVKETEIALTQAGNNVVEICYYRDEACFDESSSVSKVTVYAYEILLFTQGGASDEGTKLYRTKGEMMNLPKITRDGYVFNGWYNVPNGALGNGVRVDDTTSVNMGTTVYASWTPKPYSVEFSVDAMEGTIDQLTATVYYRQNFALPVAISTDPTKVFGGWCKEPNGLSKITDANGVSTELWNEKLEDGESFTLYPSWYTVFEFELSSDKETYSVKGGADVNKVTKLTIPAEYQGKRVARVQSSAFSGANKLVEINIPDTVEDIFLWEDGYGTGSAFYGCTKLNAVNIYCANEANGESCSHLTEINGVDCTYYESVDGVLIYNNPYNGKEFKFFPLKVRTGTYAVPDGVQTLPADVFRDTKLETIVIPASVSKIDAGAFKSVNGSAIRNIIFAEPEVGEVAASSLTIGEEAFKNCSNLQSITFPARLSNFNVNFFNGCSGLKSVYVKEGSGVAYSSTEEGIVMNGDGTEIVYAPRSYAGEDGVFEIPSGVTKIAANAFEKCTQITKLIVPSSVKTIETSAFARCSRLTEIVFLGTEEDLEAGYGLTLKEKAFDDCDQITSIKLPENLVKLEKDVFYQCDNLTKVVVNTVGEVNFATGAFSGYLTKIDTVEIGAKVTAIDINAIFGSEYLRNIIIHDDNENFVAGDEKTEDEGVLFNKDKTRLVYFPMWKTGPYAVPDSVVEIGAKVFEKKTEITAVSFGAKLAKIGDNAFAYSGIQSITFRAPKTDETMAKLAIGASAFSRCASLKTIEGWTENRVETIGANAFEYCTSLVNFTAVEGLTTLGANAFKGATALETVSLPATLTSLTVDVFPQTAQTSSTAYTVYSVLKSITVAATNEKYSTIDGVLYEKADGKEVTVMIAPIMKDGKVTIPNTVTAIQAKAFFANKKITEIKFADGREAGEFTIGAQAFEGCVGLGSIDLPAGITEIAANMFKDCKGLTSIEIPNTVTKVNKGAFSGCIKLNEVDFAKDGKDALEIAESAFEGLTSLETVNIPERTTKIGDKAFQKCTNLKYINKTEDTDVVVPAALEYVGQYAFSYTALTSFNMPEFANWTAEDTRTKVIGMSAFSYCKQLKEVSIPASVTYLGATGTAGKYQEGENKGGSTFAYCSNLEKVTIADNCKIQAIGGSAFNKTKISSIRIPATVKYIGSHAFADCFNLKSITFELKDVEVTTGEGENATTTTVKMCDLEEIAVLSFINTGITKFEFPESTAGEIELAGTMFKGSKNLTEIYLSKSIVDIGKALSGVTSITKFTVAEGHENYAQPKEGTSYLFNVLGKAIRGVFGEMKGEVEIPAGITEISAYAFENQSSITKVILPASLASIGERAFGGCWSLQEVAFKDLSEDAADLTIGKQAFWYCPNLHTVHFPDSKLTLGQSVFWRNYGLKNVTLSKNLQTIGTTCFEDCTSLETIVFPDNYSLNYTSATASFGTTNSQFKGCTSLKNVTIGANMKVLTNSMFLNCTSLTSITIPNTVTGIGSSTFSGSGLTSITLPTSVTQIGSNAFKGTQITSVVLESVTYLGQAAFSSTPVQTVEFKGAFTTSLANSGKQAFKDCTALMTVTYTNTATKYIGESMYENCTALTNVTFPTSLVEIGPSAFKNSGLAGTLDLKTATPNLDKTGANAFHSSKITKVVLKDITTIGANMFMSCESLTEIDATGVTKFGASMFKSCTALQTVNLPKIEAATSASIKEMFMGCTALSNVTLNPELEKLGDSMFKNCTSLTGITLPTNLKVLGTSTFEGTGLTSIVIPDGVVALRNDSTTKLSASTASSVFKNCASLSSVTLPSALTAIGVSAFEGCASLQNLTIPSSVTVIANTAFKNSGIKSAAVANVTTWGTNIFYGCTNLTKVELNDDVTKITNSMFRGCTSLESITLPKDLTTVDQYAFYQSGLKQVLLPMGVNTINNYAFSDCDQLTSFAVASGNAKYKQVSGVLCTVANEIVVYPAGLTGKFEVPEGYSIAKYAFNGSNLEEVVLPSSLTVIPQYAFENATGLTKVTVNGGIREIGNYAFRNCAALTTVELPNTMEKIGNNAFYGCSLLAQINLPDSITTLGSYAFYACAAMTEVKLPSYLTSLGAYAFNDSGITSITIPASITSLTSNLFDGYATLKEVKLLGSPTLSDGVFQGSGITEIVIPEGVTELPSNLFNGCEALAKVTLPSTLVRIGDEMMGCVFKGCVSLTSITLPEGLTYIGRNTFSNSGLESIEIPASVQTIIGSYSYSSGTYWGYGAFSESALQKVTFKGIPSALGESVFYGCKQLEEVVLPDGMKSLPSYSFEGCEKLSKINFPESLESLGQYSLKATGLVKVTIPAKVTSLPYGVFDACEKLEEVIFHEDFLEIGSYAFRNCTALKSVVLPESLGVIDSSAFANCTSLKSIVIPERVGEIASTTFSGWTADQTIYAMSSMYEATTWGTSLDLILRGTDAKFEFNYDPSTVTPEVLPPISGGDDAFVA